MKRQLDNKFKEYKNLKPSAIEVKTLELQQEKYTTGLELGKKREARHTAKEKDFEILEMRRSNFESYLLNCIPKNQRKRLTMLYDTYFFGMYKKTLMFLAELREYSCDENTLLIINGYEKYFVEVSDRFSPKGLVRHYENINSMFSYVTNKDEKQISSEEYVYN